MVACGSNSPLKARVIGDVRTKTGQTRFGLAHMLFPDGTFIALGLLAALAIFAVWLSVAILLRGKLYHRLKPDACPRRWVLISLLALLLIFLLWFPVWMTWPHAPIARFLTVLLGIAFAIVGLTLKWFRPLVDAYFIRKGWPLR